MGKARVGLLCVAAVLVMAGCTTVTEGAPRRAATNEEPLTGAALSDGEVDPCSLTGPAAFEEYGPARMPGVPNLDECRVVVSTKEGGAFVYVGTQMSTATLPDAQDEVADLGRGTTVVGLTDCDMALVLADGVAVLTSAEPSQPGEEISDEIRCGLAEGAARGVFGVLDGERVKYWEPESNSFATVSACDVLDDEKVAQQLGITADQRTRYPAEHQCRWGRAGGDTATAKLDFPVGENIDDVGVPVGLRPEQIGGRDTWVVDASAAQVAVCTAYTSHIPFTLGVGTTEFAALRIAIPVNAGKDVCAVARTLAADAWAALPGGN